jgi:hypothetical protein
VYIEISRVISFVILSDTEDTPKAEKGAHVTAGIDFILYFWYFNTTTLKF